MNTAHDLIHQLIRCDNFDAHFLGEVGQFLFERVVLFHPGMPAELVIKRKSRKAIDYLLDPITQSFRRAFRED